MDTFFLEKSPHHEGRSEANWHMGKGGGKRLKGGTTVRLKRFVRKALWSYDRRTAVLASKALDGTKKPDNGLRGTGERKGMRGTRGDCRRLHHGQ